MTNSPVLLRFVSNQSKVGVQAQQIVLPPPLPSSSELVFEHRMILRELFSRYVRQKCLREQRATPRCPFPFGTRSLLGHDLAVTIQNSLYRRVRARPEGPPNLYQLRGRWEWVTLLVELVNFPKKCLPTRIPLGQLIRQPALICLAIVSPKMKDVFGSDTQRLASRLRRFLCDEYAHPEFGRQGAF